MKSRCLALTLVACCCLVASLYSRTVHADDKLKPEQIVAKHLEAIGSQEDRASVKSRLIIGTSKYVRHGTGGGTAEGRAVLASENEKYMLGMKFGIPGYDIESVGFDGKALTVGYVAPGKRSPLENLFRNFESTFKHGLLTGALSSSWPLLAITEEKGKVKYAGLKKVDGGSLHQLKYESRKGIDLEVSLFFDSVTFHHVRTEYSRVVSANIGTGGVDSSAGQRETRYKLVETFSDFRREGNLTLPHEYKIELQIKGNVEIHDEWTLTLKDFVFNRPIEPKDFVVDFTAK